MDPEHAAGNASMIDAPEQQPPSVARRMLTTGIASLLGGFALWFAFLACDALVFAFRVSKEHAQTQSIFASSSRAAVGYGTAFFIAAFVVARCRWSTRAVIAAPLASFAFLTVYLPFLDWSRRSLWEALLLAIPLITSAIGGFAGARKERRE